MHCLVVACVLGATLQGALAQEPRPAGTSHALLIGVTEYPNLRASWQQKGDPNRYERIRLRGPANDVVLMKQVLVTTLETPLANIRTLAGWPAEEKARPTRANIVAAFADLANHCRPGDLAVVYLAGHGTQVPDQAKGTPGGGDEADGLDEAFLPADIMGWEPASRTIPNALLDDDMTPLLAAIRANGARVWLIVDSCHAGTMNRGPDNEVPRQLLPEDIGLPPRAVPTMLDASQPPPAWEGITTGVTCMYAVQPTQRAIELACPAGSGQVHGLFTWHLAHQLARSGPHITFDELTQQVIAAQRNDGHDYLLPTIDGERNVTILAGARRGTTMQIVRDGDQLAVDGGALHGVRKGDVFDVFAPGNRGKQESKLGQVEVTEASVISSRVRATNQGGLPKSAEPSPGQMLPADLARSSIDLRRLRLAYLDTDGRPASAPSTLTERWKNEDLAKQATWSPANELADLEVSLLADETVRLQPRDMSRDHAVIFPLHEFESRIWQQYRARGLREIARNPVTSVLPDGVRVRVELLSADGTTTGTLRQDVTVAPGTRAQVVIDNQSDRALDFYVFCLDSAAGLVQLFPMRRSGQEPTIPAQQTGQARMSFTDTTLGAEHLVVFAVPVSSPGLDYLADVRSTARGGDENALLRELLRGSQTETRGVDVGDLQLAGVTMIPYVVDWSCQLPRLPEPGVKLPTNTVVQVRSALRKATDSWQPAINDARPRSLGNIYAKLAPAIVAIRSRDGHGTGFVIDGEKGLILTNYHVVASGARFSKRGRWLHQILFGTLDAEGMMRLERADAEAEVVHADQQRDLALLQLQGPLDWLAKRPVIPVTPQKPEPTMPCAIAGHPSSGMMWSYREGATSGIGNWPDDQVDVAMRMAGMSPTDKNSLLAELKTQPKLKIVMSTCGGNYGDSGGPLLDEKGNLLGVTFAVPARTEDKVFTYHLHPDEVIAFLAKAPGPGAKLAAQAPDAWQPGTQTEWLPPKQPNGFGILLTEIPRQRRSVLLDFDGDSKLRGNTEQDVQAALAQASHEQFDFEMAVTVTPSELAVSYDRDGDGVFDLVLADLDGDRRCDASFEYANGAWTYSAGDQRPVIQVAVLKLPSKAYHRAMMVLGKVLP